MTIVLVLISSMLIYAGAGMSEEEQGLVIVHYGRVEINSPEPGARIYIDGVYMGDANLLIENVPVGVHTISVKLAELEAFGEFEVRKNETLSLTARLDAGRLFFAASPPKSRAEKKDTAPRVSEETKKTAQRVETDRRRLFVNVIKTYFDDTQTNELRVTKKTNPKAVSGYTERTDQKGRYYRNRANILMCESGPCTREWASAFYYTDENGRRDAVRITWRETVFEYVTISGVSKAELEWCVNDTCRPVATGGKVDMGSESSIDRYTLTWKRPGIIINRADLVKEITSAGGRVPDL